MTILTPKNIFDVDDAAISAIIGSDNPREIRLAREHAATKLSAISGEEQSMAVIQPGIRERARMEYALGRPIRGKWGGELIYSMLQFKSFGVSMFMRHMGAEGRGQNLPTTQARVKYLAKTLALTTILGAVVMETKDILAGKDPSNLNPFAGKLGARNWLRAMVYGGSFGLYGDFLLNYNTRYGSTPLATVAGPLISAAEEFSGLTLGNIHQLAKGEDTDAGAEAVKFFKGNTPFINMWYTKAVVDHYIIQELQEAASPGYLARMKANQKRNYGTTYWLEPGSDNVRAPDFGKTIGE